MKKKTAITLSIILMAGTFTACTAEEKVNNSSLSPTASTTVGVSVYTESSATAITEKATASNETEPSEKDTKSEGKTDSGQNSAVASATDRTEQNYMLQRTFS